MTLPTSLNDLGSYAGSYVRSYVQSALPATDRCAEEAKIDQCFHCINSPPSAEAPIYVHQDYKRQANAALTYLKGAVNDDCYTQCAERYKQYLLETVPEDDGSWSGGVFRHHYSRGAPDQGILLKVLRITTRLFYNMNKNPNKEIPEGRIERAKHHWEAAGHQYAILATQNEAMLQELRFRETFSIPDSPRANGDSQTNRKEQFENFQKKLEEANKDLSKTNSAFLRSFIGK